MLIIKADVHAHLRQGKLVNAYDRNTGISGKLHRVPVRPGVFAWAELSQAPIMADYVRLSAKHPDQMPDAKSAMHHVEWVLEHPHVYLPATDGRFAMFVRRGAVDKCVVIDPNIKRGAKGYSVRSAYVLEGNQLTDYLKAVFRTMKGSVKMRKSLSAETPSSGVLSSRTVSKVQLPMPHGIVQLSEVKFSPDFGDLQ